MTQLDQLTTPKGIQKIKKSYVRQETLQYKTFLKQTITEGLQSAFAEHPDPELIKTKIDIEYPTDERGFPQIVIKYYEKSINNAGVGHEEWGPSPLDPNYPEGPFTKFIKYYNRLYKGDLEFEIVALSSVDRDKISDAFIETIAMTDISSEGIAFYKKIYESIGEVPYSEWNFPALNTDLILPYGETQELAPWMVEDVLVYKTAYRIPIIGNFYSLTPSGNKGTAFVEEVEFYPWVETDKDQITLEQFEKGEITPEEYIKIKASRKVKEEEEEHKTGPLQTSTGLTTSTTLETNA